jgi:hypothetical protein
VEASLHVLWKHQKQHSTSFFLNILKYVQAEKSVGQSSAVKEAILLFIQHPMLKTIGWSTYEFATIQQLFVTSTAQTQLELGVMEIVKWKNHETVAEVLKEIVRAKKIQTSSYQKHENLFISSLLSDGIQLRKQLVSQYFERIVKAKSHKTETQIQIILHDCFWQTLVAYHLHRGNTKKFRFVFESVVLKAFPSLQTKAIQARKNNAIKIQADEIQTEKNNVLKVQAEKALARKNNTEKIHSEEIQTRKNDALKIQADEIQARKNDVEKFIIEETQTKEIQVGKDEEIKAQRLLKNITLQHPIEITTIELFEALQQLLQSGEERVQIGKKTYTFSEVFAIGLETSPKEIRTLIQQTVTSQQQLSKLLDAIKFEEFTVLISNDLSSSNQEIYRAIQMLYVLVKQLGNAQVLETLEILFWKETIALIQSKTTTKASLETLVKITFDKLATITSLDTITIVKHIQNKRLLIPTVLKTVFVSQHSIFELITENTKTLTLSEAIKKCIENDTIEALSMYLIRQFSIPAWFQHTEIYTYERVLHELVTQQPLIVLKAIRNNSVSEVQFTKLSQTIQFSNLIQTLRNLYPTQQKQLSDIAKLYDSIAMISMPRISTKSLQDILSKKVWTAWQTSNWSLITNTNIWNELLWETCGKKSMSAPDFIKAIHTIKMSLPVALQVTFKSMLPVENKTIQHKPLKNKSMENTSSKLLAQGVAVPNAGLVLLNNYFLMLMERLGIVSDKAFKTEEDQLNAVHYFQYIVTGLTETEESLLTLNKVLSGLSPNTPVKEGLEISEKNKQLIDGLIQAAIGYWSSIGDTSINGFRGNWLVRDGILRETEERWELTVEKRAYDILLMKSPFSFSIIKLPWMQKPLHVTWPY